MTYSEISSSPTSSTHPENAARASDPSCKPTSGRTRTWLAASIAAATAALQACGGGGGDSAGGGATASLSGASSGSGQLSAAGAAAVASTAVAGGAAGPLGQTRSYVTSSNDAEAARFLLQAQFSASETEIASVHQLGYAGWLASQFDQPAGQTAWDWLNEKAYASSVDDYAYRYAFAPIDHALWWQLIKSPDALRQRVALALSEIFVVAPSTANSLWPSYTLAAWWDTLVRNAFGNFRQLMEDATLNPAMGYFLNVKGSLKENAAGRQPDENYARELMQLMTIGLVKLNPDGTPVLSGGAPVETYTQSDVSNLARVFSGYDLDRSGDTVLTSSTGNLSSPEFARRPMVLKPSLHSTYDVNFLGTSIPGSTEGNAARRIALDALFQHANVGPFIGRQLIQRLVTSNPSPAYVARVAAAFADNGTGVRGDIAATVAAVLLDDEARASAGLTSNTFGRLREPMLRLVQWARTFKLAPVDSSWLIGDLSAPTSLGQNPLRAPSVFNFFRPGYVPPNTATASAGLVAPEFQLVNETTVSAYVNFMQNTVKNGIAVNGRYNVVPDYGTEMAIVTDAAALVMRLNLLLAAGQLPSATVALIVDALNATSVTASATDAVKLNRIYAAIVMVMASAKYLVQK